MIFAKGKLERRFVPSARGALFVIEERFAPRGKWTHVQFEVGRALESTIGRHRDDGWVEKVRR